MDAKAKAWKAVDAVAYAPDQKTADQAYTEWSQKYDQDLDILGYVAPKNVTTELMKHIKNASDVQILDVAAGTGRCGEELKKLQFAGIVDALEINAALLRIAKEKGLYRNHFECGVFEDQSLPVDDGTYDAITCAGAMGMGHLDPGCAKPMLNALKKGGVLICTVRATEAAAEYRQRLENQFENLVRDGVAEKIAVKELTHYESKTRETGTSMNNKVYIYKKL